MFSSPILVCNLMKKLGIWADFGDFEMVLKGRVWVLERLLANFTFCRLLRVVREAR